MTKDDIPFIVRCIQNMKREFPDTCDSDDDPEYVTENLVAIFDGEGFIGYMYGDQHGYMFGTVCAQWFCKRLRAYEQSLYVLPEFRGGLAAPRLIKRFVEQAKTLGAIEIYAGSYTQMKVDKLAMLYNRMGFEKHGLGFLYRIS